jgi:hypothetical protein
MIKESNPVIGKKRYECKWTWDYPILHLDIN